MPTVKRILALAVVAALLMLGIAVNNVGNDGPVISSEGEAPAPASASDDLPALGPIQLIVHNYAGSQSIPCVRSAGADPLDPVGCSQTFDPSVTGFTSTGATTAVCTGANSFAIDLEIKCETNGSGNLMVSFDITHAVQSLPCDGTIFVQVVLTNPGDHTLTITILKDNNQAVDCSL